MGALSSVMVFVSSLPAGLGRYDSFQRTEGVAVSRRQPLDHPGRLARFGKVWTMDMLPWKSFAIASAYHLVVPILALAMVFESGRPFVRTVFDGRLPLHPT